ncbi:hypothetical protein SAMN02910451_01135 [Butyrivibrio hungatei]|uniref:Uncharacterized protein n=1 Tax=Butyrivibrio hungatei TaxID=185008 RepID=A0A1G5CHG6_9FIRM|nr:hypothetical protein [Butyrivibrio hungatei]SCY01955.1 hypothetical protein SAMN02910451_01135 [Butyrivibrio hungatei]
MREYEVKLANIKKSCNTTRKIANVLGVLMAVVAVAALVGGVLIFAYRDDINKNAVVENINGKTVAHICGDDGTELFELDNLGIQIALGSVSFTGVFANKGMVAEGLGVGCFIIAVVLAVVAGIFILIMNVFKVVENSDSPFSEEVMKKLKAAFIIITVFTALAVGIGPAVLTGVVFWSIYCILDYGYVLQKEADETL